MPEPQQLRQSGRSPGQPDPSQDEKDPGSVTIFRTVNFFVHVVTPLIKTGSLIRTGALRTGALRNKTGEETLLERIRWISMEKQRLMAAQTRLLPQAELTDVLPGHELSIPTWLEVGVVLLFLAVALTVQAINMFSFPAYSIEEGNSMSNAWAILHGSIVPYTYTYTHPPLGWLQIAAWAQLTGGLASFGDAIASGRVLMLAIAAGSSLLLYLITSRLSGSRSAALLAMLIYALSPLSLLYHRQVLIENIGMFWLLLSLCLITAGQSRLRTFVLAAVAMGIAILSQGVMIIFLPAVLYAIRLYATEFQRKFSILTFLYITLAIASTYVLLALLQGQLLPSFDSTVSHPSLIAALIQQWQMPLVGGRFSESWQIWMQTDKPLLLVGTIALFINVLGGTVNRFQLLAAFLAATAWIFLLISNVVYPFSIVLLLPFLALNIAMALNMPLRWLTYRAGFDLGRVLLCFILIGAIIPADIQLANPLRTRNAAEPQRQAMLWVRDNVPHSSVIVVNSYMYSDLRQPGGLAVGNGTPFDQAYLFSTDALNSQPFEKQVQQDWQKINFLVVDPTMLTEIKAGGQFALLNQALHHSILRVQFGSNQDGTLIQVYQINTSQ